jgi:hypothetical protein
MWSLLNQAVHLAKHPFLSYTLNKHHNAHKKEQTMDEREEAITRAEANYNFEIQAYKEQEQGIKAALLIQNKKGQEQVIQLKQAEKELTQTEHAYNLAYNKRDQSDNNLMQAYNQRDILFGKQETCKLLVKALEGIEAEKDAIREQSRENQAALLNNTPFGVAAAVLASVDPSHLETLQSNVEKTLTQLKTLTAEHHKKEANRPKLKEELTNRLKRAEAELPAFEAARNEEMDINAEIRKTGQSPDADRKAAANTAFDVYKNKQAECATLREKLNELDQPQPESSKLKAARTQFEFAVKLLSLAEEKENQLESTSHRKLLDLILEKDTKTAEYEKQKNAIEALQQKVEAYENEYLPPQQEAKIISSTQLFTDFYNLEVNDKPQSEYEKKLNQAHVQLDALNQKVTAQLRKKHGNWDWWENLCLFCVHKFLGRLTDLEQSTADKAHGEYILNKLEEICRVSGPMLELKEKVDALNLEQDTRMNAEPHLQDAQKTLAAKLEDYVSTEAASVFSGDKETREKARGKAIEDTRDTAHELLEQGRETATRVAESARQGISEAASQGMNFFRKQGWVAPKPQKKQTIPEPPKQAQTSAPVPDKQQKADKADIKRDVVAVATSLATFLQEPTQVNLVLLQDTVENHPEFKHGKQAFQTSLEEARGMYSELEGILPAPQKKADNTAQKTTKMKEGLEQGKQEQDDGPTLKPQTNRGRYGGGGNV